MFLFPKQIKLDKNNDMRTAHGNHLQDITDITDWQSYVCACLTHWGQELAINCEKSIGRDIDIEFFELEKHLTLHIKQYDVPTDVKQELLQITFQLNFLNINDSDYLLWFISVARPKLPALRDECMRSITKCSWKHYLWNT